MFDISCITVADRESLFDFPRFESIERSSWFDATRPVTHGLMPLYEGWYECLVAVRAQGLKASKPTPFKAMVYFDGRMWTTRMLILEDQFKKISVYRLKIIKWRGLLEKLE